MKKKVKREEWRAVDGGEAHAEAMPQLRGSAFLLGSASLAEGKCTAQILCAGGL